MVFDVNLVPSCSLFDYYDEPIQSRRMPSVDPVPSDLVFIHLHAHRQTTRISSYFPNHWREESHSPSTDLTVFDFQFDIFLF